MLVTPSVHESMNSDLLQQLSCHLHSSCIPLLWPLLCVTLKILQNNHRTLAATHVFALGGIVGLPFALALAPFVFEELFIYSAVLIAPEAEMSWMVRRWMRLFVAGFAALLILSVFNAFLSSI